MQDISFVYGLSKLLSEINWFLCLPRYVNGIMESLENAFILRDKKREEKKENPSTFTSNFEEGWQKIFLLFNYSVTALEIPAFKQPSTWVRKIRCQTSKNICEGHCQ